MSAPRCTLSLVLLLPTLARAEDSYDLKQLMALALTHPAIEAAEQAQKAVEHQRTRAKWAWLPAGEAKGRVAPAPRISCFDLAGNRSTAQCVRTNRRELNALDVDGVQTHIELTLRMPIYTFEKIGSLRDLAREGVRARAAQVEMARGDVTLSTQRAYWQLRLARQMLAEITKARGRVAEQIQRLDQALEEDSGEATVTDLLRLKTAATELETQSLAMEKLGSIAKGTLALLIGRAAADFQVSGEATGMSEPAPRPLKFYLKLAEMRRPEVRLIRALRGMAAAETAGAWAQLWPNFLFVSNFSHGNTTSVDDPTNAFLRDPYNFLLIAAAVALNWSASPVQKTLELRSAKSRQQQAHFRAEEADLGMALQIRTAHANLVEARKRRAASRRGQEAAEAWRDELAQRDAAKSVASREFTDAIFGQLRALERYLVADQDVNLAWAELARATGGRSLNY